MTSRQPWSWAARLGTCRRRAGEAEQLSFVEEDKGRVEEALAGAGYAAKLAEEAHSDAFREERRLRVLPLLCDLAISHLNVCLHPCRRPWRRKTAT